MPVKNIALKEQNNEAYSGDRVIESVIIYLRQLRTIRTIPHHLQPELQRFMYQTLEDNQILHAKVEVLLLFSFFCPPFSFVK